MIAYTKMDHDLDQSGLTAIILRAFPSDCIDASDGEDTFLRMGSPRVYLVPPTPWGSRLASLLDLRQNTHFDNLETQPSVHWIWRLRW